MLPLGTLLLLWSPCAICYHPASVSVSISGEATALLLTSSVMLDALGLSFPICKTGAAVINRFLKSTRK